LWKLGKRQEAVTKVEQLLSQYPDSPLVLETASFIYLDLHQIAKARKTIRRYTELSTDTTVVKEMQAQLMIHEGKWSQAHALYEELYRQSQDDKSISESYAETATHMNFWIKAKMVYEQLLTKSPDDKVTTWNFRQLKEEGMPKVSGRFTYYNRPDNEDDYIFQQQSRWAVEPWVQLEASVNEEYYGREGDGVIQEIEEMVTLHSLQAKFFHQDALSLVARWDTAYNSGNSTHGGGIALNWEKDFFSSYLGYEANQLVREPIEALSKEASLDRARTNNRVRLWNNLEIGNETTVVWYEVDGNQNTINGQDDLGHKITYDNFWQIPLLKANPFVLLNYHFKHAHWDKEFAGAESVVDFLEDEQVHSAGLYLENKIGTMMDYNVSGTYNNDTKRNVDYIYWSLADNIWFRENVKFSVSFEYIDGDSGVAGKGDSQTVNALVNIYF